VFRPYVTLGPVPTHEPCSQVGTPDYDGPAECARFKKQLEELFPAQEFAVKAFSHDFGTYHEVVVYLDRPGAHEVEPNTPMYWSEA
jgi:hypothetical protein